MNRRAADLAKLPTRKPEQVRVYTRAADELLTGMIAEFTARRSELRSRVYGLLKEAAKQGIGDGADKWGRAMSATSGLVTAAIGIRIARAGIRRLYPALERHAGAEIDGLREHKYGSSGRRRKRNDDDKFEV